MKVFSAAEMQACDRATAERFGVPTLELMRAAARAVAGAVQEQFPQAQRITVLCGRGNNGGDGMMAARLLAEAGREVTTILLGSAENFAADAGVAWQELLVAAKPDTVKIAATEEDLQKLAPCFEADLIVDAVLGTGFRPPLRGLALCALKLLQNQKKILAVDLPSGWVADATAASAEQAVYPADAVVTFTAPKPAHLFGQLTRSWRDAVVVASIGSPEAAVVSQLDLHWTGSAAALVRAPRPIAANKGSFGHVLVVGGSFGTLGGKAGAPAMAALAALRAGAGLVTAAVPSAAMSLVGQIAPELMVWPLECSTQGGINAENLAPERLEPLLKGKTVLAVGPGLGQADETARFFSGLLQVSRISAVIDADGLNLLAGRPEFLQELARERTLVLTPHPGEMARLVNTTVAEVQANRLEVARSFARQMGVTLVLKGARTVVAHPDGRVAVNTSGNPGMAKGGSGDVLCGLIVGLLAQFPHNVEQAVEAAVYLHGLSADLAVERVGERALLATDALHDVGRAAGIDPLHTVASYGQTSYVFLQGLPHCEAEHSLYRKA
ncbi:NAD(P)H-hydrate dehydratase [Telmatobacter bradus]|uniref:NAD(P)H-hydrate dehydratase n=1 Tax=Telmatobacter bradus TaxID=474953 RepID=UPI003B428FF4